MTRPPLLINPFLKASIASAVPRKKVDKRRWLNLSSNEFVHQGMAAIVAQELSGIDVEEAIVYPNCAAFEEEVARRLGIHESMVMVMAGSDSAYKMLLTCLDHPSGSVITQAPNYDQLGFYAAMVGLRLLEVSYRRGGGFLLQDFLDVLSGPRSTVWISNPNGASGWRMPLDDVARLASQCAAYGHLLVVDEAYADFAECSHINLLTHLENVILIRSFSKGWAMAGGRLAWLAAHPALVGYLRAWNAGNTVSGVTIALARCLFRREREIRCARRELSEARDWFASSFVQRIPGAEALPSEANFVNLDVGSAEAADRLSARLKARGVLVRTMPANSPLAGCVRVTAAERPVLDGVLNIADSTPVELSCSAAILRNS